jgi:hypothetical protein
MYNGFCGVIVVKVHVIGYGTSEIHGLHFLRRKQRNNGGKFMPCCVEIYVLKKCYFKTYFPCGEQYPRFHG